MADNLTDTAENRALDWLFVPAQTPTRPTGPMMVRLISGAGGSDSAAGTEVANAGGSTYAAQSVVFGAAASGAISNTGAVTFTNMPAITVTGLELWDSFGTPVRLAYGALTASKTTNLGDTFTIAIGDLDFTLA
jgi:hypothetical protein